MSEGDWRWWVVSIGLGVVLLLSSIAASLFWISAEMSAIKRRLDRAARQ